MCKDFLVIVCRCSLFMLSIIVIINESAVSLNTPETSSRAGSDLKRASWVYQGQCPRHNDKADGAGLL
jgi:hypothetical protein